MTMLQSCYRKDFGLEALAREITPMINIDKSDFLRRGDWEADHLPPKMVLVLVLLYLYAV